MLIRNYLESRYQPESRTTFECIFVLFSTLVGAVGAICDDFLWMGAAATIGIVAQLLPRVFLKNARDSVVAEDGQARIRVYMVFVDG